MDPSWVTKTLLSSGNPEDLGGHLLQTGDKSEQKSLIIYYLLRPPSNLVSVYLVPWKAALRGMEKTDHQELQSWEPQEIWCSWLNLAQSILWRSCLCRNLDSQKSYCSRGLATASKICRIFFSSKTTALQRETVEVVTWLDPVPVLLGWGRWTEPRLSWMPQARAVLSNLTGMKENLKKIMNFLLIGRWETGAIS